MTSYQRLRKSINGYPGIDSFVKAKLGRMDGIRQKTGEIRFGHLFELMFSERDNIMFESSRGYQISRITYGECREAVICLTAALRAELKGLEKDAVVGLYMDNSAEWIEAFWAILLSGFRPLLMNLRLSAQQLSGALERTEAKYVLAASENVPSFPVPVLTVNSLKEKACPEETLPAPEASGSEILLMSSGTTARAKICAYSAEAFSVIIADSYEIVKRCPQIKKHYKGSMKLLTFLPFYHIFGLVAVYLWFSFFSRTFVLLRDMSPDTIMNTIRRHEVTHLFAVPMLWNKTYEQALRTIRSRGEDTWKKFEKGMRIAEKAEAIPALGSFLSRILFREVRENMFGNSIRFMITGGSEIRPCVLSFLNRIGYHIANGYGMTEIGITSVELASDRRVLDTASVGRPFSSVNYRIGEDSQLYVKGPGTAHAILAEDRFTERGEEWYATGDLAEEQNGRYYILGRMDDLVISPSGENLNPAQIEEQLETPAVRELCLIGVAEEQGVRPTLVVCPRLPLPEGGLESVQEALKEKMREHSLDGQIGQIVFVREPLIAADDIKLNRGRIRKQLAEGAYTVITQETAEEDTSWDLMNRVREVFASSLGKAPEEIGDTADFFLEEGGTSLDYFGMVSALQDQFGIPFPAEAGKTLNTIRDLARYITRMENSDG